MNARSIMKRLADGDIHYVLGRFRTVRRTYSRLQRLRDVVDRMPMPDLEKRPSLFSGANINAIVDSIRQDGVFIGLNLPAPIVSEIESFGRSEPLHPGNDPNGRPFFHADVTRGFCADGRPMPLAGVRDPTRSAAVRAVVDDPILRTVVREYLRYEPRKITTLLTWSFASDFTDEERRRLRHHVIDYHYDVGGLNFVYASFYILQTDRDSGAHMMMKRSHDRKPLRFLLGPATANRVDVCREFGSENEILIEGPPGTGFVQDTSCYHRATPPTHRDRLMLAVRFS